MNNASYFVTGTDTNVGKTIVSAILCTKLNYSYWKPIQSGLSEGTDTKLVETIIGKEKIIPELYRLQKPAAPLIAAQAENIKIDFQKIITNYQNIKDPVIVEGAGGLMVPITQNRLIIDLIKSLKLSTILVARTTLGTINHTLLSIEALKKQGITIAGIIFNKTSETDDPQVEETISTFAQTPILGKIPTLSNLDYTSLLTASKNITL
ncbi:MAG: dethiobiotin synthase [Bacteriovoracaceae bacterium]